jgi:hypothetical protein
MPALLTSIAPVFAQGRRARSFQKLMDGDPVAWSILIGAVVIVLVIPPLWRAWRNRSSDDDR